MAVGMIKDPKGANIIILNQQADLVAIGRRFLYNPR
jgi:2,4-dienoyl-CoA reductase-like NADH-dependent reductase (Old Yellow Enzyme family)